jgi:hypothetical protein
VPPIDVYYSQWSSCRRKWYTYFRAAQEIIIIGLTFLYMPSTKLMNVLCSIALVVAFVGGAIPNSSLVFCGILMFGAVVLYFNKEMSGVFTNLYSYRAASTSRAVQDGSRPVILAWE